MSRPSRPPRPAGDETNFRGRTWVTRRGVKVDRIGSAWLIRRFVDSGGRFKFVDPTDYQPEPGEIRFDMYEAEFGHVGDACPFETLAQHFAADDKALGHVAEIVHDVDSKDGKFGREEAPGLARLIAGIAATIGRDEDRLSRGAPIFEDLYAAFRPPVP